MNADATNPQPQVIYVHAPEGKKVQHVVTHKPINHLLHGFLTLFTGFWGFVWLALVIKRKTDR